MKAMKLAAVLVLALGASAAQAAGVNARQALQQQRIHRGVAQGDLTRREAIVLRTQQARIAQYEMRQRRDDGVLGPVERLRLDAMQDGASAAIWHQRHDGQRR